MSRHGLYIIGLGKGLFLFTALVFFSYSGLSHKLIHALQQHFHARPLAVYPVFWFIVMVAGLLLAFPFTLAKDHIIRAAEGRHEEMPATYWLQGLTLEIAVGVCIGCAVTAIIYFRPASWWMYITAGWIGYHLLPSVLRSVYMAQNSREKISMAELLDRLQEPFSRVGITLTEVYSHSGEDNEDLLEKDLAFVRDKNNRALYVPCAWADQWTTPEITAVAFHKHYMNQPSIIITDASVTCLSAVICFGGFAWCFPWLSTHLLPNGFETLTMAALLMPWTLAVVFLIGLPVQVINRRWIFQADLFVSEHMHSPEGLIAALERAKSHGMMEVDPPRWAEILFNNVPSLHRRIERIRIPSAHSDIHTA